MYVWRVSRAYSLVLPYIPLLILGFIGIFFLFSLTSPRISASTFKTRTVSPFTLSSPFKNEVSFTEKDLQQTLSLVHVWSSWNKASQENHAYLMKLSKLHVLPIYGIMWHDTAQEVALWIKAHGNPYQKIGYDEKGLVSVDLGVKDVPDTFIIDAHGTILMHFSGILTKEVRETLLHIGT